MTVDYNLLTQKQKSVYTAIQTFIKQKGIPPTVREIGEMVGEKTPGAVHGILNRLEQKGVIKRESGMARSVQIVADNSQYADFVYIPEIKKITKRNIENLLNLYNIEKYHSVSSCLIPKDETCFTIGCPDNSLAGSGIKYEDTLIFSTNTNLKDGDIILLMYENHILLRYYYQSTQPGMVSLKADSDLLGKEIFNKDEITIIGRLTGKYTKY